MRIKIQQFLFGKLHSWSLCGLSIGNELLKLNHEVDFISTDGIDKKFVPEFAKLFIKEKPIGQYDIQLGYTAATHWHHYFQNGNSNRFAIYAYDGTILPPAWHGFSKFVDKILPPSECAKKVFLDAKIPESKLHVIPHGIDLEKFNTEPYKLNTTKSIKILNVFGQPHRRKNIEGILEAYGKAFNKNDDVCLILKGVKLTPKAAFEVDVPGIIKKWKEKTPNHPEVIALYDYIPNIESLFLACDIHFSMSNIEMWHLPSLQSMAAKSITIQSAWGGNTDFMNEENSLLIQGKMGRCPPYYQYWTPDSRSEMFIPSIDDAIDKLKFAINNLKSLKEKLEPSMKSTAQNFTWANATNKILDLVK